MPAFGNPDQRPGQEQPGISPNCDETTTAPGTKGRSLPVGALLRAVLISESEIIFRKRKRFLILKRAERVEQTAQTAQTAPTPRRASNLEVAAAVARGQNTDKWAASG